MALLNIGVWELNNHIKEKILQDVIRKFQHFFKISKKLPLLLEKKVVVKAEIRYGLHDIASCQSGSSNDKIIYFLRLGSPRAILLMT